MRIAVLLISLFFSLEVGYESGVFSSDSVFPSTHTSIGIIISLLFLFGGSLNFSFPFISMFCFLLSGILGIFASAAGLTELRIWGFPFFLAYFSYFGEKANNPRNALVTYKGKVFLESIAPENKTISKS